MGEIIK